MFGQTQQGARLAVFHDFHNSECSFQPEKEQGQDLIWLGVMRDPHGNFLHRMLLDKESAAFLIKLLDYFIQTGKVPVAPEEIPEHFGFKPLNKEQ